jgi:hypothetical protein
MGIGDEISIDGTGIIAIDGEIVGVDGIYPEYSTYK